MKRSVQILGIAIITLLSAGDLTAQRSRSQSGDRADRGRTEARNDRGRREARDNDRSRGNRNRDGYRNVNNRNNRGTYRGNDRGYSNRNGRSERVISKRIVRYDGYRNFGSPRRGYSVVYDYDFRNGRRYRLERSVRPSRRHIWIGGHWRWSPRLQRDVWVQGRWTLKARHHRWVDGHYERFQGSRIWVDGCWTRIY